VVYLKRIIKLHLARTLINIKLIQVYTNPTADKQDSNAAQFYEQLYDALRTTKKNERKYSPRFFAFSKVAVEGMKE